MLVGFFGAEQELRPMNFLKGNLNLLESKQAYKSITNPNGKIHQLHLFKYQDPILEGLEEEQIESELEYIVHNVLQDDTLEGLALQYSVSKTAIKSSNNITSEDIFYYKHLKIPQRQMITNISKSKSCVQTSRSEENSPNTLQSNSISPLLLNTRYHSEKVELKGEHGLMHEVLSEKEIKSKGLHSAMQDENNSSLKRFDSAPYQSRPMN